LNDSTDTSVIRDVLSRYILSLKQSTTISEKSSAIITVFPAPLLHLIATFVNTHMTVYRIFIQVCKTWYQHKNYFWNNLASNIFQLLSIPRLSLIRNSVTDWYAFYRDNVHYNGIGYSDITYEHSGSRSFTRVHFESPYNFEFRRNSDEMLRRDTARARIQLKKRFTGNWTCQFQMECRKKYRYAGFYYEDTSDKLGWSIDWIDSDACTGWSLFIRGVEFWEKNEDDPGTVWRVEATEEKIQFYVDDKLITEWKNEWTNVTNGFCGFWSYASRTVTIKNVIALKL